MEGERRLVGNKRPLKEARVVNRIDSKPQWKKKLNKAVIWGEVFLSQT